MSEVLASLKKIGGNGEQYTETTLWTNPDTSADFNTQTITLLDSIGNYKYIAFKYKYGKTTADTDYALEIFPVEDIRESLPDSNNRDIVSLGIKTSTAQLWSRFVYYLSDTSLQFTLCYRLNATGSTQNGANPIEILGVNELDHNGTVRSAFCINGTSAGTTYGHCCSSSDTTLMDIDSGGTNTQAKSYTVKRNATGKVGFTFCNRGAVTRYPTVKLNGTDIYSGRLDDWVLYPLPLIDVTLSANDVIELSCGQSTSQLIAMYFIEE